MILPLLFFGALGGVVWTIAASLWDLAQGSSTGVLTKAINSELDSRFKLAPEPETEAVGAAPSAAAAEPEEPDEASARGWHLRGVVYDLLTLKPMSGCAMTFTDPVGHSQEHGTTDARGRYRIVLPPLSGRGYLVAIEKSGYAKNYLNPATEDVAQMPAESRAELAHDLAKTAAETASLQPYDERPFVTNFHLAPVR